MGFNEMVQAFLVARFYLRLTEEFGTQGRMAFVHATQHYGIQRGRRMAQRAIRDGVPALTYEVYCQYGEWVSSRECQEKGCSNITTILEKNPHVIRRIDRCAWHTQFQNMGLLAAGALYCQHIDRSICRGFNPELEYEVPQTLNTAECCIHIIRDAGLTESSNTAKKMEYVLDFQYHCAHTYWSYHQVICAIFGSAGAQLCSQVLQDFLQEYGREMADQLCRFRDVNFDVCT